ncbi:MAG: oligosaccharide flippase family protein [Thermoplasmata archaeon]
MAGSSKAGRSAIDSLGRGTATMVVGTFLLLLLNFISRVAIARRLSLTAFGDFNLGLSFAGLLSLVALLGLHQAVARTLAENPDPAVRRRLVAWTAWVTGAAAVVTSLSVYLLAQPLAELFTPTDPATLIVVFQMFSVTIGLSLLCTFIASIFQGFEDTVPYAILNQGLQPAAFLVFVFILFYFHLELTAALIAWVASNFVAFGALVIYAWARFERHVPPAPRARDLPSGLWLLSLSLWGVTTLAYVTGYADTLILGAFRPEAQVGIYSAIMTIGRLILIAAGSVTFIFMPVAARLTGSKDFAGIRTAYVTAGRWVLVFTVPMFLVFGLLPRESIGAIFGRAYIPGAEALTIVSGCALVSVAFGPVNAALAGMAMTRPLLFATAVSAISNVVLSFALIPTYGLIGAAIAWSIARIAYPAAGALALHRSHRIGPLHRSFVFPLALSLAAGIPLFVVVSLYHFPAWIVFPMYIVGVLVFLAAILVTRSVLEGDLVAVRMAERVLGRQLPGVEKFLRRFGQPGEFTG